MGASAPAMAFNASRVCPESGCCEEDGDLDSGGSGGYEPPPLPCFDDLQAAIDATSDGGRVLIEPGEYRTRVKLDDRNLEIGASDPTNRPLFTDPRQGRDEPLFKIHGDSDVMLRELFFDLKDNQAVEVKDGRATLESLVFDSEYPGVSGAGLGIGAILRAQSAVVSLRSSSLTGGGDDFPRSIETGQIQLAGATLEIVDSTLKEGKTAAIVVPHEPSFASEVTLSGGSISGYRSWKEGVINGAGTLVLRGVEIYDNAPNTAAELETEGLIVWRGDLSIEDALMRDNLTKGGGAVSWGGHGTFTLVRTALCENSGAVEASSSIDLVVYGDQRDAILISNNRFVDNDVAIRIRSENGPSEGQQLIAHNHFLGNSASNRSVIDGTDLEGIARFTHNVVAFNQETSPEGALTLVSGVDAYLNLWWGNEMGSADGLLALDPDGVLEDPLISVISGEDCSLGAEGKIIGRPSYYGGTVDRGDLSLMPPDLDGSAPDLGAWGGPLADPSEWADEDGDRVGILYDCDPADPSIGAGISDTPYDGIDANCEGDDDYDADDDTFCPDAYLDVCLHKDDVDCDDTNPKIAPDLPEIPVNGTDDDCDGWADEAPKGGADAFSSGGLGCAALPSAFSGLSAWWIALLALLCAGRARAEQPACSPLDESTFRSLMLDAQTAADRADPDLHRVIVMDLRSRLPCLQFAPTRREWAEYLVLEALMEFGQGGDWQLPLSAALTLRPSVDRGVGERHPIARFEPTARASPPPQPVPEGIVLFVDGEPAEGLPSGPGIHLVQREQGGQWRSAVQRGSPLTLAWLVAPFVAKPALHARGHAALSLGAGGNTQRRAASWAISDGKPAVPDGSWTDGRPGAVARGILGYGKLGCAGEIDIGLSNLPSAGHQAQATLGLSAEHLYLGAGLGIGSSTVVEADTSGPTDSEAYERYTLPAYFFAATAQRWQRSTDLGLGAGLGVNLVRGSLFAGLYPSESLPLRLGLSGMGQASRFLYGDRPAARLWSFDWRAGVEIGVQR